MYHPFTTVSADVGAAVGQDVGLAHGVIAKHQQFAGRNAACLVPDRGNALGRHARCLVPDRQRNTCCKLFVAD
jgi:hypothetical protein